MITNVIESITNVVELNCSIIFVNDFAERLRFARELRGLSQAALAKSCALSQSAIANYENRTRKTAQGIFRIAEVLDVSPVWLAMGSGPMIISAVALASRPSYTLSETPPGNPAMPLEPLAAWPFECLSPEDFWALSQNERKMIEQAVIALTRSLQQKTPGS